VHVVTRKKADSTKKRGTEGRPNCIKLKTNPRKREKKKHVDSANGTDQSESKQKVLISPVHGENQRKDKKVNRRHESKKIKTSSSYHNELQQQQKMRGDLGPENWGQINTKLGENKEKRNASTYPQSEN